MNKVTKVNSLKKQISYGRRQDKKLLNYCTIDILDHLGKGLDKKNRITLLYIATVQTNLL